MHEVELVLMSQQCPVVPSVFQQLSCYRPKNLVNSSLTVAIGLLEFTFYFLPEEGTFVPKRAGDYPLLCVFRKTAHLVAVIKGVLGYNNCTEWQV